MNLLNNLHIRNRNISPISLLIIIYLIFIIFPFSINKLSFLNFFPDNDFINFLKIRTINSFFQFLIIITYIVKVNLENKKIFIDQILRLIIITLIYSFLNNLIINDFNFKFLLNISYHESYFVKYGLNILTSIILLNELIMNNTLKKSCINIIICSCFIISLLFIITQITNIPIFGVQDEFFERFGIINPLYSRYTFEGHNPNEISLLLTFSLSFVLTNFLKSKSSNIYKNFIPIIICSTTINSIILTGTRMGMIVLIFSLLIVFLFLINEKHLNKQKFSMFLILLSYSFTRIYLLVNPLKRRFIIDDNLLDLGGRLSNWINDLKFGFDAPLLGKGIVDYFAKNRSSLPENIFLELFITSGLIAFILIVAIVIIFLKENTVYFIKYKKIDNILLIPCLLGAIISLNIISIKSFWFVLAILSTNILKERKSYRNKYLI